jgi:hypothetical protein
MANEKEIPKEKSVDERLLAILEAQQQASQAQATMAQATAKRLAPKSLEVGEIAQRSAFNPRGEKDYPMPRLKCEVFAPHPIQPNSHGCTREEVELFNLLEQGSYPIKLNDDADCIVAVTTIVNKATGTVEQMHLTPDPSWSNENRQRFPSTALMLREMLGEKAKHVVTMKAEKAQIANGTLAVSTHG